MEKTEARLIAEQLGRLQDSINARLDAIEERLKHHTELDAERVNAIRADLRPARDEQGLRVEQLF